MWGRFALNLITGYVKTIMVAVIFAAVLSLAAVPAPFYYRVPMAIAVFFAAYGLVVEIRDLRLRLLVFKIYEQSKKAAQTLAEE